MSAVLLPPSASPQLVHAAGAVVWRDDADRLEVMLVHRPRYKDWSWPKGKLDPGESVAAAAVREVQEETGVPVVLGVPLPLLRYRLADGRFKQVRYWAATEAGRDHRRALAARAPVTPAGLDEVDDVVWVSARTARELLTRKADHRPLDVLAELWRAGRLRTRALVVARHGQAVPRARWREGEASRPLTGVGRRQADAMVAVLAAFGIRQVVTSPWERCLATVQPYARLAGVPLEPVDALTEAAHQADPQKAAAVVADHLAEARDAVLATHRPVLPTVLDAVSESTRRWTHGLLPAKDPYLRTGEALAVHVTGSGTSARVVALEHHRPVRSPGTV